MKTMYFGTRERMAWVACPAIEAGISRQGWGTSGTYLNGGRYARNSTAAAKVYQFSWNLKSAAEIRKIMDYADGLYGGPPFYFLDPFTVEDNVLPQFWATPRQANDDAPPLVINRRPTLVDTAANNLGYPTKSAVYTITADDTFQTLWVPVPPGYTFHLGVHGSATGTAGITVTPDGGSPTTVTPLNVTTAVRTNHSVSATTGVTLAAAGVGQLTLAGLIAQVLPDGQSVESGDFISGDGNSGCDFEGKPAKSGYSAVLDKQGLSATLVEVGAWL
jgi:hypothetical protein